MAVRVAGGYKPALTMQRFSDSELEVAEYRQCGATGYRWSSYGEAMGGGPRGNANKARAGLLWSVRD